MINTINTIIFDLDGTLLNTLTDLTNSLNYALEQLQAHMLNWFLIIQIYFLILIHLKMDISMYMMKIKRK